MIFMVLKVDVKVLCLRASVKFMVHGPCLVQGASGKVLRSMGLGVVHGGVENV